MKFFMKSIIILSLVFCALLVKADSVLAVRLSLIPEQLTVGVGQQFSVELFLDTGSVENINAMEGTLSYANELLELKEIQDGNSIVNFWIERPKNDNTGHIRFSGITPGGYRGQKGFVFKIIFEAKAMGSGTVEIHEQNVLRNDGQGTSVPVQTSSFRFVISQTNSSAPLIVSHEKDRDPPEAFILEIARDPNLFENRWFVVFATQDKGSGIDHYEIQERYLDKRKEESFQNEKWIRVESPYVLQDQALKSFVYVRAVDKAGNERIAMLAPHVYPQYTRYIVWSILGILIIWYLLVNVLWRKRRRKYN